MHTVFDCTMRNAGAVAFLKSACAITRKAVVSFNLENITSMIHVYQFNWKKMCLRLALILIALADTVILVKLCQP